MCRASYIASSHSCFLGANDLAFCDFANCCTFMKVTLTLVRVYCITVD